jgi:hypothetical protein
MSREKIANRKTLKVLDSMCFLSTSTLIEHAVWFVPDGVFDGKNCRKC